VIWSLKVKGRISLCPMNVFACWFQSVRGQVASLPLSLPRLKAHLVVPALHELKRWVGYSCSEFGGPSTAVQ